MIFFLTVKNEAYINTRKNGVSSAQDVLEEHDQSYTVCTINKSERKKGSQ